MKVSSQFHAPTALFSTLTHLIHYQHGWGSHTAAGEDEKNSSTQMYITFIQSHRNILDLTILGMVTGHITTSFLCSLSHTPYVIFYLNTIFLN
jgi:hypothetical protein